MNAIYLLSAEKKCATFLGLENLARISVFKYMRRKVLKAIWLNTGFD